MSVLRSYMENKELRFRVSIGRKTLKGFKDPIDALRAGIDAAQCDDPRAGELLKGKPLNRQVRIIFGADVMQQYFGSNA